MRGPAGAELAMRTGFVIGAVSDLPVKSDVNDLFCLFYVMSCRNKIYGFRRGEKNFKKGGGERPSTPPHSEVKKNPSKYEQAV